MRFRKATIVAITITGLLVAVASAERWIVYQPEATQLPADPNPPGATQLPADPPPAPVVVGNGCNGFSSGCNGFSNGCNGMRGCYGNGCSGPAYAVVAVPVEELGCHSGDYGYGRGGLFGGWRARRAARAVGYGGFFGGHHGHGHHGQGWFGAGNCH